MVDRFTWPSPARRRRLATGSASATGMATAGPSARFAFATDLIARRSWAPRSKPGRAPRPGFFFFWLALCLRRRLDRAQHLFARPAIDLEACGLLVGAERSARLHARLAVDLVLVEPRAREPALHRLDIPGSQLLRGRPRRRERLRARHAVGEMADEQHVEIGEIVFLDDEVVLRGQEGRAVDAFGLQQRGRLGLLGGSELLSTHRHKAFAQPLADRLRPRAHAGGAIALGGCLPLVTPARAALPPFVDELLRGGGQRIRHRMPDVDAAVAVEIDAVLVIF